MTSSDYRPDKNTIDALLKDWATKYPGKPSSVSYKTELCNYLHALSRELYLKEKEYKRRNQDKVHASYLVREARIWVNYDPTINQAMKEASRQARAISARFAGVSRINYKILIKPVVI